jgi:hypothetical protein
MPQITKRNIAKAAAAGFALGVFSCYLMAECSMQNSEKSEASPKKRKPELFPQSATVTIAYGHTKNIGGFDLTCICESGKVSAVAAYRVNGRDFRTRLDLHEGIGATISIPEKKIRLAVTLIGSDGNEARLNVRAARAE